MPLIPIPDPWKITTGLVRLHFKIRTSLGQWWPNSTKLSTRYDASIIFSEIIPPLKVQPQVAAVMLGRYSIRGGL